MKQLVCLMVESSRWVHLSGSPKGYSLEHQMGSKKVILLEKGLWWAETKELPKGFSSVQTLEQTTARVKEQVTLLVVLSAEQLVC